MNTKKRKRTSIACGSFGYIKTKKKQYLIKLLIEIAIALGIFVAGYFLNDQSPRNVWSIAAILMVLPGAKALVALIVFLPYHTVEKKRYEAVYQVLREGKQSHSLEEVMSNTVLVDEALNYYTDVVFTSPDKVMNLDYLVVAENRVLGLLGKKTQDIAYIESYLQKGLNNKGYHMKVKVFQEETKYISALKTISVLKQEEECTKAEKKERKEMLDYLNSLIVR